MRTLLFLLLLMKGTLFTREACAQEQQADSLFTQTAAGNLVQVYTAAFYKNLHLYNGPEYISSYPGVVGSPFFHSDTLAYGSVVYEGILYPQVLLAYDMVRDEVVVRGFHDFNIRLVPQKVNRFSLAGHSFVRLTADSTQKAMPATGFYDVVYEGKTTVLVKRRKQPLRSLHAEDPFTFGVYTTYFVRKGEAYYAVTGRKSLLSLFSDRREEVSGHLKKSKLNFKKAPEEMLISAARFYDQLNN